MNFIYLVVLLRVEITHSFAIFGNARQLMGMEACDENGDEECLKRRIITEAHLDYIYTQHHKP
ncbi:hypothetical protein WN944_027656 [Citrus x changshan-huyou]|uniref:Phytosulfokine n=1 Tax=Citrus x changshan-huyou TaxID=2935761 RepID=A0AAP0LP73_9ROSI